MDDSPRARLVEGLTDALRRMLLAGDVEGSQVALQALGELARLGRRAVATGSGKEAKQEQDSGNVTPFPTARRTPSK